MPVAPAATPAPALAPLPPLPVRLPAVPVTLPAVPVGVPDPSLGDVLQAAASSVQPALVIHVRSWLKVRA